VKYYVSVNGQPHEVTVVERLGELEVSVDGEPMAIEYEEVDRLGQVAVRVDQKSFGISIEGDEHAVTAVIAGHLYAVEIEDARERAAHAARQAAAKGGGVVTSVMPGIVAQILVERGARVEKGQPLLVLEAMKMQNEIAAPSDGIVKEIHVAEREAVGSGTKLVTLQGTQADAQSSAAAK
jgi:glutaconyl-CoA/methylmalonyl-CoA decarboxylase subunit gamma